MLEKIHCKEGISLECSAGVQSVGSRIGLSMTSRQEQGRLRIGKPRGLQHSPRSKQDPGDQKLLYIFWIVIRPHHNFDCTSPTQKGLLCLLLGRFPCHHPSRKPFSDSPFELLHHHGNSMWKVFRGTTDDEVDLARENSSTK